MNATTLTTPTIEIIVNEIPITIAIQENKIIRVKDCLYTFSEGVYYCEQFYEEYNSSYFEMKNGEWHRNNSPLVRQGFAPPYEIAFEID